MCPENVTWAITVDMYYVKISFMANLVWDVQGGTKLGLLLFVGYSVTLTDEAETEKENTWGRTHKMPGGHCGHLLGKIV